MREKFTRKNALYATGVVLAPLALVAAMKAHSNEDTIHGCPDGWAESSNAVPSVHAAHVAIVSAQTEFKKKLDDNFLVSDNKVDLNDKWHITSGEVTAVPVVFKKDISDKFDEATGYDSDKYDLGKPTLEGLGDEFCNDASSEPHVTPDYTKVRSALEVAGVSVEGVN